MLKPVFKLPPQTPVKQCFVPPHQYYQIEYEMFENDSNSHSDNGNQPKNLDSMAVNSGSEGTYVSVVGVETEQQIESDYGLYDVSLQTIEAYQDFGSSQKQKNQKPKPSHIYFKAKKSKLIRIKIL